MFNITDLIVDLGVIVESGIDEISEDQLANIIGSEYRCEFCGKRFLRKEDLEDHKTAVKVSGIPRRDISGHGKDVNG